MEEKSHLRKKQLNSYAPAVAQSLSGDARNVGYLEDNTNAQHVDIQDLSNKQHCSIFNLNIGGFSYVVGTR